MCIGNYMFGCGILFSGRALGQGTVVPRLSTKGKKYQGGPREMHAFNPHTQGRGKWISEFQDSLS